MVRDLSRALFNVGKADNAASSCQHGIARVQTKFNGVSVLATVLTGSIYTPLRVRVWCSPAGEEGLNVHELIDMLEHAKDAEEALKILNEAKLSPQALDAVEEAFLNGPSETDAPAEAYSEDEHSEDEHIEIE